MQTPMFSASLHYILLFQDAINPPADVKDSGSTAVGAATKLSKLCPSQKSRT